MSLETVAEDIRDEARERAREIRAEAEERADDIVAEAESDADDIVAEAEREAEREITQEREQKLSSAKLEAKQDRLEARRDALADVREAAEDRISSLSGDEREALTRELLDAASEEFDAESVQVYARADDAELVQGIIEEYDGYEYAGEYDCLGGVVVESTESRVRVNNTFDSVLETVWEDNLKDISARLFDGEQ
jgi:V/A-type H+-transporting ATPase subunit E